MLKKYLPYLFIGAFFVTGSVALATVAPFKVYEGGTGRNYFSPGSVLVGNGSGAISTTTATDLVAPVIAGTTTDALSEGATNKYYSDTLVNTYVNASGTIPKTYTPNIFTALNQFPSGISNLPWLKFATTTGTPTYQEGQIYWDATDHTLAIQTEKSDTTIQVGQEQVARVVNKTGSLLSNGTVVYINGAQGNRQTASPAIATSEVESYPIGIVTSDIPDNEEGYVTTGGTVHDFNTSGFTDGQELYLSTTTPGGLVNYPALAPQHNVRVARTDNSTVNGSIFVHILPGYEISELHDVRTSSPATNDVLTYNSTAGYWLNSPISTILGYTPMDKATTTIDLTRASIANLSIGTLNGILKGTAGSVGTASSADIISVLGYTPMDAATTSTGLILHNSLASKQGGSGSNFYHSDQAINTTDSPSFANLTVSGNATATSAVIGGVQIPGVFTAMKDPTGFVDYTDSVITFSSSTRTFTLAPVNGSYDYYRNGVKYSTTTSASVVIPNTAGQLNYIFIDGDGYLKQQASVWNFWDVQVATVYWNGTDGVIGFDRHGITMDWATHKYNHYTEGTKWVSGLTGTFTNSNTFSMTTGTITDEDNVDDVAATTTTRIFYRTAASGMTFTNIGTAYFKKDCSGTNLCYDNGTVPTASGSNNYVNYYVYGTNDRNTTIYTVMGQAQHTTLALARAESPTSISFGNLPVPEMVLLYKVILRNNATTYIETTDYRGGIGNSINGFTPTSHSSLSNLEYSVSGHLGFAGTDVANTFTYLQSISNATTSKQTISGSLWLTPLVSKLLRTSTDGLVSETTIGSGLSFNGTTLSTDNTSTSTLTSTSVKGGVERVIDSATGDSARTTAGWIEDEKYGIYLTIGVGNVSSEFDSAVTRTGRLTAKLTTTSATGRARLLQNGNLDSGVVTTEAIVKKYGVPVIAGQSYRLSCYVKTDSVASNSVYIDFGFWDSTGGIKTGSVTSNKLSGTNDWTLITTTFTAPSGAAYGAFRLLMNVAGDAQVAWFDVNSMTLEEVSTITNSSASSSRFFPKLTAVTTNDNIDQSQVVSANTSRLGEDVSAKYAQQFLPTKKNLTGIIFQRGANTGTFTGDVTVSIQANGATVPSGTPLASYTYTNAQWQALSNITDYTVSLPLTLTVDGSTTYWIVFESSTVDNSNYTRIVNSSSDNPYSSGVAKAYTQSITTWGAAGTKDAYFKTLYSKNTTNLTVSTASETISVTAPTTDGWSNGTVIDTADPQYGVTPLTLAPGANTVYFSSNGPSTADGTVDPSFQGTFSGTQYPELYTAPHNWFGLNVFWQATTSKHTILDTLWLPGSGIWNSSGKVGIGTTTPYSKLSVWGSGSGTSNLFELTNSASTTLMTVKENGNGYLLGTLGIATTSPATALDVNGTITQSTVKSCSLGLTTDALGSITGCVVSDRSVKKNIQPLISSIENLLKLKTVTYQWKDTTKDTKVHSGFIAQDVEKVFPSAVVSSGANLKGVDSNAILSLVVHSFQDFYKEFQKLVAKVSGLEKRINEQQKQIDNLQKQINALKVK